MRSTKGYTHNRSLIIIALFALLIIGSVLHLSLGAVKINIFTHLDEISLKIIQLRFMRLVLALIAGGGLAVSGVILQGLTRNPLAEPYLLGISSGAALGAVSCLLIGVDIRLQPIISFLFAALTFYAVYSIAKVNQKIFMHSLILSGVIISILISSVTMFLVSLSPNEALHGMSWWSLGSLHIFSQPLLIIVGVTVTIAVVFSLFFARNLNAISLGEEEAMHLGIDVEKTKKILFLIAALITASLVSTCGMIGFVGLIIPHMCRLLLGPNHRVLMPASVLAGAAFLIIADIFSRNLMGSVEVPIGVITALIGAPVFIILFKHKLGSRV
ncbi:MAG: iron ABC transporter permease [Candidatus Omnitrophica bacterium]|nr:iron ABC transporter permease [Candidatus Omnitrophota bacterium]